MDNVFVKIKGFLNPIRKRNCGESLNDVQAVYIIPTNRKHDSGFYCMDFVAIDSSGSPIVFGGGCDSVHLNGSRFSIECPPHLKYISIWNRRGEFSVSPDRSTIEFIEK